MNNLAIQFRDRSPDPLLAAFTVHVHQKLDDLYTYISPSPSNLQRSAVPLDEERDSHTEHLPTMHRRSRPYWNANRTCQAGTGRGTEKCSYKLLLLLLLFLLLLLSIYSPIFSSMALYSSYRNPFSFHFFFLFFIIYIYYKKLVLVFVNVGKRQP